MLAMIPLNLTKNSLLIFGFLIMAACSVMMNFKQARVVDAMGDIASVKHKISELRKDAAEEDISQEKRDKINEKIKELQDEDIPAQQQDVSAAMAALPNGAVLWTFISQLGAGMFGLGILSIFIKEDENPVVRSTALLLVGGMILVLIIGRSVYTMVAGGAGTGGLF